MDHLQNENSKLQNLFQEKSNLNENIRQEVARLSSENSVGYYILYPIFHSFQQFRCRVFRQLPYFHVINRFYRSSSCRLQSCRDKSKNWSPTQRCRAESQQVVRPDHFTTKLYFRLQFQPVNSFFCLLMSSERKNRGDHNHFSKEDSRRKLPTPVKLTDWSLSLD